MFFFTISGWVIAVAMAVWRICDAIKNRIKIRIQIDYPTDKDGDRYIVLTPINESPRPVNLVDVGFSLAEGHTYSAFQRVGLRNLWVYRTKVTPFFLKERDLKEYLKEIGANIHGMFVVDERGNRRDYPIPERIKNINQE